MKRVGRCNSIVAGGGPRYANFNFIRLSPILPYNNVRHWHRMCETLNPIFREVNWRGFLYKQPIFCEISYLHAFGFAFAQMQISINRLNVYPKNCGAFNILTSCSLCVVEKNRNISLGKNQENHRIGTLLIILLNVMHSILKNR